MNYNHLADTVHMIDFTGEYGSGSSGQTDGCQSAPTKVSDQFGLPIQSLLASLQVRRRILST